jgi:hypothetical protein
MQKIGKLNFPKFSTLLAYSAIVSTALADGEFNKKNGLDRFSTLDFSLRFSTNRAKVKRKTRLLRFGLSRAAIIFSSLPDF